MAPHFERAKQQDDAGKKDSVLLQEGPDHGWQHAKSVMVYVLGTLFGIIVVCFLIRFAVKRNFTEAVKPYRNMVETAVGLQGGAASTTSMLSDLTRLSQL